MDLLEQKAKELRKKTLDLAAERKEGHLGGAFSEIEILVALYEAVLKPEDKFILSKGHSCIPLFVMLKEKGLNPKVSGHPDIDEQNKIHCTSGSLGHGFPIAIGMAFARKLQKKPGDIYVLIGDGECQEGTIWESALLVPHHKLTNLTLLVDYNKLQGSGKIQDILSLESLKDKFEAFGWNAIEINGHDFNEIIPALQQKTDKPKVIIANTIKGKGISFMEDNPKWHGGVPQGEQLEQAYKDLGEK